MITQEKLMIEEAWDALYSALGRYQRELTITALETERRSAPLARMEGSGHIVAADIHFGVRARGA